MICTIVGSAEEGVSEVCFVPDFGAIRPASVAFVLPLVLPELPELPVVAGAAGGEGVGNGVSFFCPPECFFWGGIVNESYTEL